MSSSAMCDSREFCRSSRDSTIGINFDVLGEVEHFEHVSGDLYDLFKSKENTDVTFIIGNSRFPAHRVILAARCAYFRCLLFGEMKEAHAGAEIAISDTTPDAFEALLEYAYSGRICLSDRSEQVILDLLGLSNKYDFSALQQSITAFLRATLSVSNACLVYNVASFYQLKELCTSCSVFIDIHASEVMKSDMFLVLSKTALLELIRRDSFFAPEMEIFRGILRWMERNDAPVHDARELLSGVRLQQMPLLDYRVLREVRKLDLFKPENILDAIERISEWPQIELSPRGLLIPDENVATPQRDASTIDGQGRDVLLNGDAENYNGEHGYTTHTITGTNSRGITVQLNQPYLINCIRMLLWDRDNRSYSYYVEVSLDRDHWVRVVDMTEHLCRSWQELFFPAKVIRYVRIVGVYNSMNRTFHLVTFACLYSLKSFNLSPEGMIIPTENVASVSASATVLEGVSRSRNALLNGNTRDYDWDSGYTCHQLFSGSIVIQLAQPYLVSSMRLLLWDCDDRTYSYYIQVSTDHKNWKTVADKSKEACWSWQVLRFEPTVVAFIKIVGTQNTANEVFHIVHFECPASQQQSQQQSTDLLSKLTSP